MHTFEEVRNTLVDRLGIGRAEATERLHRLAGQISISREMTISAAIDGLLAHDSEDLAWLLAQGPAEQINCLFPRPAEGARDQGPGASEETPPPPKHKREKKADV